MDEQILKIAQTLCGLDPAPEALRAFCRAAEETLRGRLRGDAACCEDSLLCAAAMLAAGSYLSAASAGLGSFTAGTLSVSRSGTDAAGLIRQAEEILKPYLKDRGFAFLGV